MPAEHLATTPHSSPAPPPTSTEITVRGSFSAFQPPERATVHATVGMQGPAMEPVYGRVAADLGALTNSLLPLHRPNGGPVTWWSAGQLRTWSSRPWNNEGRQLPLVHHASATVAVKFSDFAEMSRWIGTHTAGTEGFRVTGIEWALTAARRDQLNKEVRTKAVADAVVRAEQYAAALGFSRVRPVAVADAGMLGSGLVPSGGATAAFMRAASAPAGGGEVALVPEDIEVSATVDARFVASAER